MNENDNNDPTNTEPGFFTRMLRDDGIQRSIAGVIVAATVAVAKDLLFGKK